MPRPCPPLLQMISSPHSLLPLPLPTQPLHSIEGEGLQKPRRFRGGSYRANKKRCMRSIMGEETKACEIEQGRLLEHFNNPATLLGEVAPEWLCNEGRTDQAAMEHDLTYNLEVDEIESQLKRLPWQSAPGPDGIAYHLWKATPGNATLLTKLYNTCLINGQFPPSWKRSNTILFYKKGDESLPANWRPISLQPTVYKIFAAAMAKHLASWAIGEGKISSTQKGFLPMEGCAEHCFLMESLICDAKRRRKDLRILWLDLKNAFGSVSHDLLWFMMRRLGDSAKFITICKNIYSESSQRVRCSSGYTEDISLRVGIKQGCPLSPLLFNIALEGLLPILREKGTGYQFHNGATVKQLAYADDLCLIAKSKDEITNLLKVVSIFSSWSGLKMNAAKCGCLSINNSSSRRRYVESFSPPFENQAIPALRWEDTYKYLGVEIGRPRRGNVDPLLKDIENIVEKIKTCRLEKG